MLPQIRNHVMRSDPSESPADNPEGDLVRAVHILAEQSKYAAGIALLDKAANSAVVERQRLILSILKNAHQRHWQQA